MTEEQSPPLSQDDLILLRRLGLAALICIATIIAYIPSIGGEFVWDDNLLLAKNPLLQAPNGLFRIWFSTDPYDYWPVTYTLFWIEWHVFDIHPLGYHAVNILLHLCACFLLWKILVELEIPGAWLAALLFALHPVNVASVAWVTQQKNTLSLFFLLLSALFFVQNRRRSLGIRYWLSLIAFLLAMLSKGSVAVFPAIMLLVIWWREGRIVLRDVLMSAPFFLIAGVLVIVNIWFQTHGSGEVLRDAGFLERLLGAGAVVWFYLFKAIAPVALLPIYPNWEIRADRLIWWILPIALIGATAIIWIYRNRLGRGIVLAWGFYCIALVPVMGFTDVGFMRYALVADHYQHIALLAVVSSLAAGFATFSSRLSVNSRIALQGVAGLIVVLMLVQTFRISRFYQSDLVFFSVAAAGNPDSYIAQANLGAVLTHQKKPAEGLEHLDRALHLRPSYANAHSNRSAALQQLNRWDEAIAAAQDALKIRPDFPEATHHLALSYFGLAVEFQMTNDFNHALESYSLALAAQEDFPEALMNVAAILNVTGNREQALAAARRALEFARKAGNQELIGPIETWLAQFDATQQKE